MLKYLFIAILALFVTSSFGAPCAGDRDETDIAGCSSVTGSVNVCLLFVL